MKLTITYIELRNPFLYFALTYQSLFITLQLHKTNCVKMKNTGFGTKHYTMTLWENEADLKNFARNDAHLKYMKKSGKIAKAIKILTIDATEMPSWKEAKAMLATVKPIIYK